MSSASIFPAGVLMLAASCCLGSGAYGQGVPPPNSQVETAYPGASIYTVPGRLGQPLTAAHGPFGTVDATITLTLLDSSGYPVADFPADDIWLESPTGSFAFPPLGTTADGPTDQNGQTWWTHPLDGGGCTEGALVVWVGSMPIYESPLDLRINSADQNGDLLVDLQDLAIFGESFGSTDAYCADLNFDGVVNIVDFFIFRQSWQDVGP